MLSTSSSRRYSQQASEFHCHLLKAGILSSRSPSCPATFANSTQGRLLLNSLDYSQLTVTRAGALLILPAAISHIASWHQPALTISALIIYTYLCFYPYMLVAIPGALVLVLILVPGYDSKHPRNPDTLPTKFLRPTHLASEKEESELAEFIAEQHARAAAESQKQFLERLLDLQTLLSRLVYAMETFEHAVYTVGSFVDETLSTTVYLSLLVLLSITLYVASKVPVNLALCATGWAVMVSSHPLIFPRLKAMLIDFFAQQDPELIAALQRLQHREVVIDDPPEEHTVEIFELQRVGLTPRQWSPWVFTSTPYELTSPLRICQDRPVGSRFLDEVLPPEGWFFEDEQKWTVDLTPKHWVAHRGLLCCEMGTDDGWVYDWTEAQERGDWRRRRWIRTCFRYAAED